MGESISDQELRRRLLAFNTVVPPVTKSTRSLLLRKLAHLESSQSSIIESPKGNDNNSLFNVSNWNLSASEDEDLNTYLLPGTSTNNSGEQFYFDQYFCCNSIKLSYRNQKVPQQTT